MTTIPQHPLRNGSGQAVSVDLQRWGAVQHYDFLKAHRHHFYEILVFINGSAQHDIDFNTYKAKAGSVHFVAPDNVHLLVREKNSSGYSLLFTPDYFTGETLAALPFFKPAPVLHLGRNELKKVNTIAQQVDAELESRPVLSERMVRLYMETLLLHLARSGEMQTPGTTAIQLPEHIQLFKQLVKENYLLHDSVERYAGKLNISPKHLIELCKKHTGRTPLNHIREQVVCEAKRLLFHTSLSVKEIAYQLNFDEPANFSKYFKSHTGYSPAAYREGSR